VTTRLVLVRHGQTDGNASGRSQGRRDVPLNERGRKHARALAEALSTRALAAVVSSPASRCHDTARAIAEPHGLAVALDPRLVELDQGELDGLTGEEMRARFPGFLERWRAEDPSDLRMPGGETMREAQERMLAAAANLVRAHAGSEVAVVSHNLAIKALLCHALGAPLAGFRRLQLNVASISVVDVEPDGRWRVMSVNERCHDLASDG